MTTPPPAGNVPDDLDPSPVWTPPDEPGSGAASPEEPPAPARDVPHPPGEPAVPAPGRTNRLAIIALVTALAGAAPPAIGLAVAALVQTGRSGEKGRGLAVGALAASACWAAAGVVVLVLAAGSLFSADRDESGRVRQSGRVLTSALRVGDCFSGEPVSRMRLVTVTPCDGPHDGEVIATPALPDGPYPGDEAVSADATELCAAQSLYLLKSSHTRDLRSLQFVPDQVIWESGNRQVTCAARYTGPGTLTSPLAATVNTALKTYNELAVGDCIENWPDDTPVLPIVACTKPHELQVYGVFQVPLPDVDDAAYDLPFPPYPGEKKVKKLATRACDSMQAKVFKKHPPEISVDLVDVWPREVEWEVGMTTAVCLIGDESHPLRRSLVPVE